MDKDKLPLGQQISQVLTRPFLVFFREPMLITITLYMIFLYGVVYLLFKTYPTVFTEGSGMMMSKVVEGMNGAGRRCE